MRRLRIAAVFGLAVVAAALAACSSDDEESSSQASAAPGTGTSAVSAPAPNAKPAPEITLELFGNANHPAGEQFALSHVVGKPAVVNFWYPSCPPCRLEMPDFEAKSKEHPDVEFVGVMSLILDTVDEGQEFVDEFGLTYRIGPDPENTVIDYGVIGFPTSVFLDKDHNVVRKWTGALNAEKLEELIQEVLP